MLSNIELFTKSYHIFTNSQSELFIKNINISEDTIIIHKNQTNIYNFLKTKFNFKKLLEARDKAHLKRISLIENSMTSQVNKLNEKINNLHQIIINEINTF